MRCFLQLIYSNTILNRFGIPRCQRTQGKLLPLDQNAFIHPCVRVRTLKTPSKRGRTFSWGFISVQLNYAASPFVEDVSALVSRHRQHDHHGGTSFFLSLCYVTRVIFVLLTKLLLHAASSFQHFLSVKCCCCTSQSSHCLHQSHHVQPSLWLLYRPQKFFRIKLSGLILLPLCWSFCSFQPCV